MAEYETNPIARDSDDKRIYRAEARASRKSRSDAGGRRGRWRRHPYRRAPVQRRAVETIRGDSAQTQAQQNKRPGLCFGCSMPGHWKFECPSLKFTNGNNKISSIFNSVRQENQSKQYNVNTNLSKIKVNVSMTDDDSGIDDK